LGFEPKVSLEDGLLRTITADPQLEKLFSP
jgi:hypothetical protein